MGPELDVLVNEFAVRSFRDVADGDYIAARMACRAALVTQFQWSSQQAVEKILKALLTEWGVEFRRTHNIVDLLSLLNTQYLTVNVNYEEAGFLNAIYRSRYPADAGLLPHGDPTEDDANKALALAKRVVEEGKSMLERRGQ